jgi:molybdopterin synthase catalytic subunit
VSRVSGATGAGPALGPFEITAAPLSVDQLAAEVQTPADGAVVTFVGLVRDNHQGKRVVALEYEAYPELAERELRALSEDIAAKYGLHGIGIRHRTGRLAIGEISVVIAVAAPHRAEAFAACAEALDRFKATVPVWKKEWYEDGSTWLGQAAG